jgi:hypothetical protein
MTENVISLFSPLASPCLLSLLQHFIFFSSPSLHSPSSLTPTSSAPAPRFTSSPLFFFLLFFTSFLHYFFPCLTLSYASPNFSSLSSSRPHPLLIIQGDSKVSVHTHAVRGTRNLCVCHTKHVRHLGRVCAQGLLNHFPVPPLVVLTGAQGLLNYLVFSIF